jgi:hypothetical protein
MQGSRTETVIFCDACDQVITRPLQIGRDQIQYASLGKFDLCSHCSCFILENLYTKKKFDDESLEEAFKHYAIHARASNIVLT